MNKIKLLGFSVLAFVLSLPLVASAHVKWFVNADEVVSKEHGLTPFYYLTSKEVLIWAGLSILIVILFSIFDRLIPEPVKLREFGEKHEKAITKLIQFFIGLLLISITFLWKIILVPDFPINSTFTVCLEVIQLAAGFLLAFNITPRLASVFIVLLYIVMGFSVGWIPFVENIMLVGIAAYIFIKDSPSRLVAGSLMSKLNTGSVEIVRLTTAVSLIVLAFTEKLMYPELGLAFLNDHQWNFMQLVGMGWFNNDLFVLSAGFSELIFGVIFIFGYLTRINTLVMSSFFAMSVVTMFIQFGKWEMEDLTVYAAAVIFIFYGYGKTRFFHTMPEHSIWRRKNITNFFKKS